MKYLLQTFVAVVALGCARVLSASEEDPVKIAPDNYKVLLKNRQVRVVEARIKAGTKVPMHEHPDCVIYVIKGGKARFTDEKGHSREVELKAGEVQFRDHEEHAVENIGRSEIRVLHVEMH